MTCLTSVIAILAFSCLPASAVANDTCGSGGRACPAADKDEISLLQSKLAVQLGDDRPTEDQSYEDPDGAPVFKPSSAADPVQDDGAKATADQSEATADQSGMAEQERAKKAVGATQCSRYHTAVEKKAVTPGHLADGGREYYADQTSPRRRALTNAGQLATVEEYATNETSNREGKPSGVDEDKPFGVDLFFDQTKKETLKDTASIEINAKGGFKFELDAAKCSLTAKMDAGTVTFLIKFDKKYDPFNVTVAGYHAATIDIPDIHGKYCVTCFRAEVKTNPMVVSVTLDEKLEPMASLTLEADVKMIMKRKSKDCCFKDWEMCIKVKLDASVMGASIFNKWSPEVCLPMLLEIPCALLKVAPEKVRCTDPKTVAPAAKEKSCPK